MPNYAAVGVRFGASGPVMFYATTDGTLEVGERVLAPGETGPAVARVVVAPSQILRLDLTDPLPELFGRAPADSR